MVIWDQQFAGKFRKDLIKMEIQKNYRNINVIKDLPDKVKIQFVYI